ncbi:response regulator [Methylocystis parvus OBBP]|uniref:Response regulator n=1 Tax=Methylocystis parvus TaxID=134 RepID=A0A6B8MB12_9HYPH|nr:response regulator [Methylocystis parvus]QGM98463.1 response regulator [Methylocystis parvus]WBK01198.1 response regulator [Methylocystis parvus OBBP]
MLLNSIGVETQVAYSGPEALDAVPEYKPDVVFLDLGMPRMDGCETARRIRATTIGAEIPLIALSGWGRSEDREITSKAGFSHHFVKPIALDALRQVLAPESIGG